MSIKTKSLLDELDQIIPERDSYVVMEAKADHFINSGINLLEQIEELFNESEADELKRRLFTALKGRDFCKFQRKIRQLKENRNDKESL